MRIIDNNGEIVCVFGTAKTKKLVFDLVRRHIELMPKVYRKRNANWVIIKNLMRQGCGYSCAICKALGVEPYGYKWEILK